MKILILGGDGFCGWPTALHLSSQGHDIVIIDNLSRRQIDESLGTQSLTPISALSDRVATWRAMTKCFMEWRLINVAEQYDQLLQTIKHEQPDAIIHFAEQRAAPFSMKSPAKKRYTVDNNVNATHNLLCAVVESGLDTHILHLGTMGVYGYGTAGSAIPEGYIDVAFLDRPTIDHIPKFSQLIRYPSNPGSVYHMTKCLDAEMFAYYAKNDRLRITDLHQGIIWGTNIEQTKLHPALINRFDYDGDYGTVLNRFIVEAAIGYPLTMHGTGGQTRAFIHIQNAVECISLALANPPARGDRVKIFNQMTETHRISDIALKIAKITGAPISSVENPRNEAPNNDLDAANQQFLDLGLSPITLSSGLVTEVLDIVERYKDRVDASKIPCTSRWVK